MSFSSSKPQAIHKPLRILMVSGVYPTEQRPHKGTFVKSQLDSLVAAGLEVEVVHPKPGPVVLRYAQATLEVFLKTLNGHFDIVHGHYGLWCLVARMQWTTPVVASFIGSDLLGDPTGDGGYTKKSLFVIHVSRWLCRRVESVIVKSEQMKKDAAEDSIIVLPDGVDFELFHPIPRVQARTALGWDQDRYYVLFGNDPTKPRKNYPLAQAAVESLRTRGIFAELVVANGLPQTELVQYINASNALILTSIHEGSPNGVKEAMACNVPVVSVDVGDVSEVISRTKGCKVCPHDPNALAAALEEALQLTEATTGRVDIAYLENSVVAKQIIDIYQAAINKKRKKGGRHVKIRDDS
jgi:teichuronic acid biosynthesis glycosyltransferase TuaC